MSTTVETTFLLVRKREAAEVEITGVGTSEDTQMIKIVRRLEKYQMSNELTSLNKLLPKSLVPDAGTTLIVPKNLLHSKRVEVPVLVNTTIAATITNEGLINNIESVSRKKYPELVVRGLC